MSHKASHLPISCLRRICTEQRCLRFRKDEGQLSTVLPFHFFQNPLKTGRKTPDIPPDFFTACKFPKNSPIVNPYLYESTLHYLGVHIVLITSAII